MDAFDYYFSEGLTFNILSYHAEVDLINQIWDFIEFGILNSIRKLLLTFNERWATPKQPVGVPASLFWVPCVTEV